MKLNDFIVPLKEEERRTVVLPFAYAPDIVRCVASAMKKELASFILVGEEEKSRSMADREGVDISGALFIQESDPQKACLRAVELVRDKRAHALMKGSVQSSDFIGAALNKEFGLIPSGNLISCVAIFEIPDYHKLLLVTDPGVNISPSLEAKKRILYNAIDLAGKLGIARPKAACVSAVEKVSKKMPGTLDAREIVDMARSGAFCPAVVDGPFGFDVAISRTAAGIKNIPGEVAGDPDVVLFPDIISANVLYKSLVWCARAKVAGIVVGAKVPIVLTSRSDSEEARLHSVALAMRVV